MMTAAAAAAPRAPLVATSAAPASKSWCTRKQQAATAWDLQRACPQLIDPSLDFYTLLLLRRLRLGVSAHAGRKAARVLLAGRIVKPALLVVCTDAYGEYWCKQLDDLRGQALAAGVPVVHALSRRWLGSACGVKHLLTVVTVVSPPSDDESTRQLLAQVMEVGAQAYAGYADMVSSFSSSSLSPPAAAALSSPVSPAALALALHAAGGVTSCARAGPADSGW